MNYVGFLALCVCGSLTFDWLLTGRLAALAPSVPYHYRPTPWRYAALFLATAWVVYIDEVSKPWFAGTAVGVVALISYGISAMIDVLAQRNRPRDQQEPDDK